MKLRSDDARWESLRMRYQLVKYKRIQRRRRMWGIAIAAVLVMAGVSMCAPAEAPAYGINRCLGQLKPMCRYRTHPECYCPRRGGRCFYICVQD